MVDPSPLEAAKPATSNYLLAETPGLHWTAVDTGENKVPFSLAVPADSSFESGPFVAGRWHGMQFDIQLHPLLQNNNNRLDRKNQIFVLGAFGLSESRLAQVLCLAQGTIHTHREGVSDRLGGGRLQRSVAQELDTVFTNVQAVKGVYREIWFSDHERAILRSIGGGATSRDDVERKLGYPLETVRKGLGGLFRRHGLLKQVSAILLLGLVDKLEPSDPLPTTV